MSTTSSVEIAQYYGFSFQKENAGGLGAALHAMMLALHYAHLNGHIFGLVDVEVPRLNGSINDMPETEPNRTFHSYFKSFSELLNNSDRAPVAVWQNCPNGYTTSPPEGAIRMVWYSHMMKEIFQLQPHVAAQVEARVIQTGFNATTDVVLHVRRTDKIAKYEGSVVESAELPLREYFEATMRAIRKLGLPSLPRVYLCTDDKLIFGELQGWFQQEQVELIMDATETPEPVQALRIGGKLTKSAALEENMVALTNLTIMARGLYLVGGRMSYFFRVAELLRYPLPTLNIKDQEMFGKAPYAEPSEPFANPFYERRYHNFVSPEVSYTGLVETLERDYIVTVPNFMSEPAATQVLQKIQEFPKVWYTHATMPSEQGWAAAHMKHDDPRLAANVAIANATADQGMFAYYFKRSSGGHYATCNCYACRLEQTFSSYEVMRALSQIVGRRVISMGEMFASLYERDNFLTLHHDKKKGDYTFILSLTKNWNVAHGGLTCFYDPIISSVYKTVSPRFNTLTIFKLSLERQMDHFVSRVSGPNERYSFTGWFNVE